MPAEMPDRLDQLRSDLEEGKTFGDEDFAKLTALQGLDLAVSQRQFFDDASARQDRIDDDLQRFIEQL